FGVVDLHGSVSCFCVNGAFDVIQLYFAVAGFQYDIAADVFCVDAAVSGVESEGNVSWDAQIEIDSPAMKLDLKPSLWKFDFDFTVVRGRRMVVLNAVTADLPVFGCDASFDCSALGAADMDVCVAGLNA